MRTGGARLAAVTLSRDFAAQHGENAAGPGRSLACRMETALSWVGAA